jgi:hypothetical protein
MSNKLSKCMEIKIARIKYVNISITVALLGVICILFSTSVLLTFAISAVTFILGLFFVSKIPKNIDKDKKTKDK